MSAHLRELAWTLDEFLAWERRQELRYEFDGVQPTAMTGGSPRHSDIASLVDVALRQRLLRPCRPFRGDVKIRVAGNRIRYPDVAVTRPEPLTVESDILPNPVVVFGVLSPSTAAFDRSIKAAEYAATPSVQVYVTLEQDRPQATVLRRAGDGWAEETASGANTAIALPEIGIPALPLRAIYPDEGA